MKMGRSASDLRSGAASTLWKWYLGAGLMVSVGLNGLVPPEPAKLIVWPAIGWSSVAAIVPRGPAPSAGSRPRWYLLAPASPRSSSATTCTASATTCSTKTVAVPVVRRPRLPGDVPAARRRARAPRAQAHSGPRSRQRSSTPPSSRAASGSLSWVILIVPYVRSQDMRPARTAHVDRLSPRRRRPARHRRAPGRRFRPAPLAFWLLAGSIVPLLVADALYGYMNLPARWHEHNPVDLGWIAFYVGWGAAALHPSMRELSATQQSARRGSAVVDWPSSAVPH